MALQIMSQNWQVAYVEDHIMVTVTQLELDSKAIWLLIDELTELAQDNPNILLDLRNRA